MMCIHGANIPQNKAQYDRPERGCQQALGVFVFVRVDSLWDGLVVWLVWTACSGLRDIHQKISGFAATLHPTFEVTGTQAGI